MTIQDLQAQQPVSKLISTLQAGSDYMTPVIRYLQQQQQGQSPTFNRQSLANLFPQQPPMPATTSINTTPASLSGLLADGKLVENYLTSRQLIGGNQTRAGNI